MHKKCIGQYDDDNDTKMSLITLTELGYRLSPAQICYKVVKSRKKNIHNDVRCWLCVN